MQNFAIAKYDIFQGNVILVFVQAENAVKAVKQFLVDEINDEEIKQSQIECNQTLPDTLEDLLNDLASTEVIITIQEVPQFPPLVPNKSGL